ncbi:hypothetical protein LTR94_018300 [Friedmanniomyces endolithicus]|nr:hypothetical protein LTR94_018300 [Friedmanniomyces endolithicus]
MGGAVLQGLELADQTAELFAGAQILQRDLEGLVPGAGQGRGGAGAPQRQGGVQQDLPPADGADHGVGVDFDVAQRHAGGVVGVDHDDRTAEPMKGDGVRVRPRLSAITPASTAPRPRPPCASGIRTPAKPISPKPRHRSGDRPSGSRSSRSLRRWSSGACSARKPSAASWSIVCSSVRIRGIGVPGLCGGRTPPPLRGPPPHCVGRRRRGSGARQLQQVFGDDVQLNLAGPALDGIGLGAQPVAGGGAAVRAFALPFQGVDPAGRHPQFVAALVQFRAVVFQHGGDGRMGLFGLHLIAGPLHRQAEGGGVDLQFGDPGAQHGVVQPALGVGADRLQGSLGQGTAGADLAHGADHGPLMGQQIFGHVPAAVQRADQVFLLHPHIVEEGFAEGGLAADQGDGPGGDARRLHVEQDEGDAQMFGRLRIGADQAEDPVGLVGVGGPDLLAVDDPVVAAILRLGLDRGQVGAGAGLGIALAPADFAAHDLGQEPLLLFFGPEGQKRRAQHPDAETGQGRLGLDAPQLRRQHLGLFAA